MSICVHIKNTQPKNLTKSQKPQNFPKKIENLGKNNACMHEEKGKEEIENTYQVREAWIRPKM